MTPEMRRLMDVLVKYKVSLPVGALVELGLLDERAPSILSPCRPPKMTTTFLNIKEPAE